jgi:hypothetical protein
MRFRNVDEGLTGGLCPEAIAASTWRRVDSGIFVVGTSSELARFERRTIFLMAILPRSLLERTAYDGNRMRLRMLSRPSSVRSSATTTRLQDRGRMLAGGATPTTMDQRLTVPARSE